METSHWAIIATCQPVICPRNLYDFPHHLPSQRMVCHVAPWVFPSSPYGRTVMPRVTLAVVTRVTLTSLTFFFFPGLT
jgi:hypothetical protein